jgi:hypothetical protein
MNNNFFKISLGLLLLFGATYLVFWRFCKTRNDRRDVEKVTASRNKAEDQGKPAIAWQAMIRAEAVPDGYFANNAGGNIPADTTIIRLARDHPELGLSLEQIVLLQKRYSELTEERAFLEVKLATITTINANRKIVSIPAYFEKGVLLLDALERDTKSVLGSEQGHRIMDLVLRHFSWIIMSWDCSRRNS